MERDFKYWFQMGLADGKIIPSTDGDCRDNREGWFITPDMREKLEALLDQEDQ